MSVCDPELLRYREARSAVMGGRAFHEMTPTEARETYATASTWGEGPARMVAGVVDEGPYRIYRPFGEASAPVVLFFHGGGWVFGSVDTHDGFARLVCDECAVVVVSVEYPLAPEYPFPAALQACVESVAWAKENAAALGGDPDTVLVMGDSSGANLAAATALECEVAGQVLFYPPLVHVDEVDAAGVTPWAHRDERFGPSFADTTWYWGHYVEPERAADPRASVLLEHDLSAAPPAVIAVGMLDTYHDECRAYASRLADSGVPVRFSVHPGLTHGYVAHSWLAPEWRSSAAQRAVLATLAETRELARR